jgi:hypothetical protein
LHFASSLTVWTSDYGWYTRYYTVNATLFGGFVVDSLRIYTYDKSNLSKGSCLVGLNFLKRFNVFFDRKNKQVILQPVKNFQRIVNPGYRRFHYLADRKGIVKVVADYRENYFKTAGLQVGDEIVAMDGKFYKDVTYEEEREFYKKDTLVYDVIRDGNPVQIVVPVDKTERQGD